MRQAVELPYESQTVSLKAMALPLERYTKGIDDAYIGDQGRACRV